MAKHTHLIGIGGIVMSGIAQLLLSRGQKVSGSDLKESNLTQELRNLGARVFIGHHPENIQGADLIVYSSAIKADNPEIQAAKSKGVPLIKRAQALADLMRNKTVIAVTCSHGKTTTASLISYLLLEAGLFPTVAIGGILRNIDSNARIGNGKFFVAEADESDGSFLYYQPKYSVITNIDYEHLDYYQDFQRAVDAFKEFLGRTDKDGCVFCCADDINLKRILKDYKNRSVLFGLSETAQIYPRGIKMDGLACEFDCFAQNRVIDRFHLALGGMHNISNALAVIALGLELGIDLATIKKALCDYRGAKRRLEVKFAKKYLIIDDYAHHPTEIKATLAAIKNLPRQRVIAIFQPHRYSRTKLLLDEFARSFALADYIIITDIYPASEPPIAGISGRSIYDKIRQYSPDKEAHFLAKEKIIGRVLKMIKPQDVVVTLGAGDISRISDELVERIKRQG